MKSWSSLSAVVLAGALMASPSYAGHPSAGAATPDDRTPLTYEDRQAPPDMSGAFPSGAVEVPAGKTIEGKVAVVEHESGRFVLDTDDGPISLVTTPDELSGVQVGDVVRVSLVIDDGD